MASARPELERALQDLRDHYDEEGVIATPFVEDLSSTPKAFGGFSTIHTATWIPKVAVKTIKLDASVVLDQTVLAVNLKRLRQEVSVWRRLQHENVQNLRGVYWPCTTQFPAMISDWEEKGNLDNHLGELSTLLSGPQLLDKKFQLLEGVLLGLAYLHSMKVVHADIKSENVLITPRGKPLLCDFGISWARVKISVTFTRIRDSRSGTPSWMAPELLEEPQPGVMGYTYASDIWAFGCLISRVLGDEQPFNNKTTDITIIAAIQRGEFFPRPPGMKGEEYDSHWALVFRCCMPMPSQAPLPNERSSRPSAIAVLSQLQLLRFLQSPALPPWAQVIREKYLTELKAGWSKARKPPNNHKRKTAKRFTDDDELVSKRYRQNIATSMAAAMKKVEMALLDLCSGQGLWGPDPDPDADPPAHNFGKRLSGSRPSQGVFPLCVLDFAKDNSLPSDTMQYARLELGNTFMGCWRNVPAKF